MVNILDNGTWLYIQHPNGDEEFILIQNITRISLGLKNVRIYHSGVVSVVKTNNSWYNELRNRVKNILSGSPYVTGDLTWS